MSIIRCWHLAVLILCGLLTQISIRPVAAAVAATSPAQIPAQAKPPSNTTYPQIVRISYLEGDVRVMRGKGAEKASNAPWEKAVAGLPLETGFSLVTGTGRAEIEFEDASTIDLADNSALTFNDIHTTSGIPYTVIALLTGTVTLHVLPQSAAEVFILKTPTGFVTAKYPNEAFARITSFIDGYTMTFERDMTIRLPGPTGRVAKYTIGQTLVVHRSGAPYLSESKGTDAFAGWDTWVAERVGARAQAEAAMMKASGLTAPIPGLADMDGQGRFFPCPPYGTCWEPTSAKGTQQLFGATQDAQAAAAPATRAQATAAPAAPPVAVDPVDRFERETSFPCSPDGIQSLIERDRVTGKERVIWSRLEALPGDYFGLYPYDWAICHAGFWIYRPTPGRQKHYVWVVGHKRHHHPPVRWVKSGRSVAYVPLHPHDVTGKPPINRRHDAFVVNDKEKSVERVTLDPRGEIKVLDVAPKEFRKPYVALLERAEDPRVEVHKIGEPLLASKDAGPALTFDHKSQSFLLARPVMQGDRTITKLEPFRGSWGDLQVRVQGVDAHGNYSTRSNSGGSGRGAGGFADSGGGGTSASRGGSSSGGGGGASRSGGGGASGGGGGGSHGGGGFSGGGGSGFGGGGGDSHGGGGGGSSGSGGGGGSHR
jgi:hypothetical protein